MKKLLTFMLALLLSIAFVACSSSDTPKKKAGTIKPPVEKKMCTPAPGEICPAV